MMKIKVVNGPQEASAIILGCMRMPSLSVDDAAKIITTAVDNGINYFDNATCYTQGEAETRFGDAFAQTGLKREDVFIQSKVGLEFQRNEFDWTKENILTNVDASLKRMKLDYMDGLLLHRPDVLFDPEEVSEAFEELEKAGKVRHFGVSNVPSMQIELLKKFVKQPLIFNQLQLSLEQSQLIDQALYLNNKATDMSIDRDNGTLDYCRLNDITIQAWSPLQYGMIGGSFIDHQDFPELNQGLQELADKYGVTKAAIAIAWILRHPAKMQAIVGTMNPQHLIEVSKAADIQLTHHEWYQLYLASGKYLP
ncbi:putative voltage-gated potassium channel subunit beta [Streptococcus parauberis]|uniref:Oxidoreductase, aldo/keto reductase family n=1 Tax=Streptococcus parauberis KRS-02083 TaxID=1207545 RepID=A0ABP2SYN6_9STRE|nr:aldo/keto reductase [Streptococcus parauberis]AUT06427.1 putative voltage-gated potassium channel subunit beta [Streptococcus parauberis]EMG25564.1 Oxidoreductase, aldo/keto reductase family [Streptococcus parauberis KRS-02083]UWV09808.1 aldo/keto reductase [Streptococcus parauberis]WEM61873.1 aldo/keto reductase [Streptococcus parauberis]WEM64499.1 aldo/keto reductase [Streptococcus parauberis]